MKMDIGMNTIRLLGAAQLLVFAASLLSERLLASVVGTGSITDTLVNISKNLTRLRISTLVALINCLAIILLAVMFYIVFKNEYKIIALVALGCFIAEAITLAVSKIGAYSLIPLSQEFVQWELQNHPTIKLWEISCTMGLIDGDTISICCSSAWAQYFGITSYTYQTLFLRHCPSGVLLRFVC